MYNAFQSQSQTMAFNDKRVFFFQQFAIHATYITHCTILSLSVYLYSVTSVHVKREFHQQNPGWADFFCHPRSALRQKTSLWWCACSWNAEHITSHLRQSFPCLLSAFPV